MTSPRMRPDSLTRWMASGWPRLDQSGHVTGGVRLDALFPQFACDCPSGRACLDAADLAAAAEWCGFARELDMADIACGTLRATIKAAFRNDAAADARPDLDENHLADVCPSLPMVAQRQKVHVVLGVDWNAESFFKMLPDFEIVPSDHHGRTDDPAVGVVYRGRQAYADAQHVAGCFANPRQKRLELLFDPVQNHSRAAQNIERFRDFREDARLQVGDGDADMLLANVDGEDDSKVAVEVEGACRASATRKRFLGLADQPRIDQACEFLVYGRPRDRKVRSAHSANGRDPNRRATAARRLP